LKSLLTADKDRWTPMTASDFKERLMGRFQTTESPTEDFRQGLLSASIGLYRRLIRFQNGFRLLKPAKLPSEFNTQSPKIIGVRAGDGFHAGPGAGDGKLARIYSKGILTS
jgi:hypothetical protein